MPLLPPVQQQERAPARAAPLRKEAPAPAMGGPEAESSALQLPPWQDLAAMGPKRDAAKPEPKPTVEGDAPAEQHRDAAAAATVGGQQEGRPDAKNLTEKKKDAKAEAAREREGRERTEADAAQADAPEVRSEKAKKKDDMKGDEAAAPAAGPPVMRRASEPWPSVGVQGALSAATRSRGRALPGELLSAYAQTWGEDFSEVVVHTDAAAAQAAVLLEADAFTLGEHLYFGPGRYAPTASEGARLLAHELAHVVQLRRGDLRGVAGVSTPSDPAEIAAESIVATRGAPRAGAAGAGEATAGAGPTDAPALRKATDGANAFLNAGYFQQAKTWNTVGADLDAQITTDASEDVASMPTPTASLGPETAPVPPPVAVAAPLALTGEIALPEAETATAAAPEASQIAEDPDLPSLGHLSVGQDGDSSAAQASLGQAVDAVPTSFDVATTPGDPPPVQLDGSADPAQTQDQASQAGDQAENLRTQAAAAVAAGKGPEQVQPDSVHETHELAPVQPEALEPMGEIPEMATLGAAPIPEEVQAATDALGQQQMQASMAEADAALETASADHEAQRQAEIDKANADQAQLDAKAAADQDAEVARARGEIDGERQSTLDEQQAAVDGLDTKAETERQATQKQVDDRVDQDQKSIDDKYTQAEKDAQAEKDKGEAEAKKEKEDAEKKSEDQSWWESALDAIGSFFDALLDAVNKIFDALVEAVGKIIDAAKAAVSAIIDAVRDFAIAAVKAYGELLKGLVDGLLGDIFPGLAAALDKVIDAAVNLAVSAINAIADAYKAAVLALLDTVGAAVTAVINAYRSAITMALSIAKAALTGDWATLGKLVLDAALQLAGIPPDAFYPVIDAALGAIDTILADPGAFVGHLIDAVALGFQNFASNFLEHLKTGFFEWIVGPLGELGITLPDQWDLMGILSLVLQVLGLTKDGIKAVIVEELGETAGVVFDYVWRYVGALVEGGIEGLWNAIKDDLGSLWDMVVDGIKSWLLETIVTQAVLKIASLFNPAGALLQLLVTVWNVYTWLRDNIQRIWGVVTSVVNMMASIAAGNLQPAAQGVEDSLAKLIPIAINLLANILGLGGITKKVQEVLESVRSVVRNALKKLIGFVKGLFTGGGTEEEKKGEEDAATASPIGEDVPVSGGGESHTLSVQVHGADAALVIRSEPTKVEVWLAELTQRSPWSELAENEDFQAKLKKAKELAASANVDADKLAAMVDSSASSGEHPQVQDGPVVSEEHQLATVIAELLAMGVAGERVEVPVQVEKEQHTLIMDGTSPDSDLMIATTPQKFQPWFEVWRKEMMEIAISEKASEDLAEEFDAIQKVIEAADGNEGTKLRGNMHLLFTPAQMTEIKGHMAKISTRLALREKIRPALMALQAGDVQRVIAAMNTLKESTLRATALALAARAVEEQAIADLKDISPEVVVNLPTKKGTIGMAIGVLVDGQNNVSKVYYTLNDVLVTSPTGSSAESIQRIRQKIDAVLVLYERIKGKFASYILAGGGVVRVPTPDEWARALALVPEIVDEEEASKAEKAAAEGKQFTPMTADKRAKEEAKRSQDVMQVLFQRHEEDLLTAFVRQNVADLRGTDELLIGVTHNTACARCVDRLSRGDTEELDGEADPRLFALRESALLTDIKAEEQDKLMVLGVELANVINSAT